MASWSAKGEGIRASFRKELDEDRGSLQPHKEKIKQI